MSSGLGSGGLVKPGISGKCSLPLISRVAASGPWPSGMGGSSLRRSRKSRPEVLAESRWMRLSGSLRRLMRA